MMHTISCAVLLFTESVGSWREMVRGDGEWSAWLKVETVERPEVWVETRVGTINSFLISFKLYVYAYVYIVYGSA